MDQSQALVALSALSEDTRLSMFRHLATRGAAGASAGEVAEAVGASSSRASFHLSALARAGLITAEKQSRQMIYRVDFPLVGTLMSFLIEDCCAGNPVVASCCGVSSKEC